MKEIKGIVNSLKKATGNHRLILHKLTNIRLIKEYKYSMRSINNIVFNILIF